jgi:polysaccharide export outer membrane protein
MVFSPYACFIIIIVSAILFAYTVPLAHAQSEDYVIGPEDVLEINVWDNADLSGKFAVSQDGLINYHLIGEVKAAGFTEGDLGKRITQDLADGYIVNPQVSVRVIEYRSQKVFIVGEVFKPGTYYLTKKTTLVEAISMAGGPTKDADREVIIVRRGEESGDQLSVDLRSALEGDLSQNIYVQNDDSIFVPKAKTFFIMGEVKKPGEYNLDAGTSVRKAISLAGGSTDKASMGRTRVIREVDGQEVEQKVALDEVVRPNDTIVVPESIF